MPWLAERIALVPPGECGGGDASLLGVPSVPATAEVRRRGR